MANRITIAIRVWLVAMLFAGIATIVGFIAAFLGTGFHSPNPPLAYITLTVLPFLATATPTKLLSGYVSRASNGAFHAGPMVMFSAAGCLIALLVGLNLNAGIATWLLAGIIGPLIGAMLGTAVKRALSPVAAGAISAALGVVFTYTASNP